MIALGLEAIVDFLVVKKTKDSRNLRDLDPGDPGDVGDGVTVTMPDGHEDQLICLEPGVFNFHIEPSADIHLKLIYEDDKRVVFGLTKAQRTVLRDFRRELYDALMAE